MAANFLSVVWVLAAISSCSASFNVEKINVLSKISPETSIPDAAFVVPILGKSTRRSHKQASRHQVVQHLTGKPFTAELAGAGMDEEYLVNITVAGNQYPVIADTGSSDTWLVQKGFKCSNLTSYPEPESECNFGPAVFDPKKSKTFKNYPGHNFNISYGDGEFLTGSVGFETVSAGGLAVTGQEMGVVNKAAWSGDGISSGLMGLAYPRLTSVYNTTDVSQDGHNTSEPYSPFFFNAVEQKKVKPYFSVALNRGSKKAQESSQYDPHLGYIAFGGMPPLKTTGTKTTVKVQTYKVSSSKTPVYYYWTVPVDKYTFPGSSKLATNGTTILDTGTTLNYVATEIAAAFNKAFKPPAKYDEDSGLYIVNCNATAPAFSAVINGVSFTVDPRDNILPAGPDESGKTVCISGTQDGGPNTPDNVFILGDVFLHNVVATFQTSANAVTITERAKY